MGLEGEIKDLRSFIGSMNTAIEECERTIKRCTADITDWKLRIIMAEARIELLTWFKSRSEYAYGTKNECIYVDFSGKGKQ